MELFVLILEIPLPDTLIHFLLSLHSQYQSALA